MSAQEYDNIVFCAATGISKEGKLRFASQGLGWKSKTEELFVVQADHLKRAYWVRSIMSYQLRLGLPDEKIVIFDNFSRDLFDEIKEVLRIHYKLALNVQELSVKGWNWGKTELLPEWMSFKVSNKTMFEVPYKSIKNATAGKNEVTIDLNLSTKRSEQKFGISAEDELVECRLHVPGMAEEEDESERTAAEKLCEMLRSKSEFGSEKGKSIGHFRELPFLTPRGRYDVEMFSEFMRLRGKSYDYKLEYSSITRLFVLPKPDNVNVHFVIGLDPPLRQGQTRYPFLVLQFARDEEISIDLNLDDPEIQSKFGSKLSKNYEAATCTVVPEIFRGLTGRRIIRSGTYRNTLPQNESVLRCSLKANEGFLHILDKAFLFIPKPTMYIEHSDINHITYSRVSGGSSRTFDLVMDIKGSSPLTFSNIAREEYNALEVYFTSCKISTKGELSEEGRFISVSGDASDRLNDNMGDDEDDDDFVVDMDDLSSGDDFTSEDDSDDSKSAPSKRKSKAQDSDSKPKKPKLDSDESQ